MACELLLLSQEDEGTKLLLIEEPEAHLHAQRQLRVMKSLQEQAKEQGIQVIVTTHSPNLASAIALDNIVMVRDKRGFSLAHGLTELTFSDYRFLERFLDVTKANLFFASGVIIVEGDAENILVPAIASLIGRDFTKHGVSTVNVGGVGLRRYAKIFQRKDVKKDGMLNIPVACLADMDVMPNCAPVFLEKVAAGETWPSKGNRKWRAKKDFTGLEQLVSAREAKAAKASGQGVKTFVSDEWTLEYDLAIGPKDENGNFTGGLSEDVYVAAACSHNDEALNAGKVTQKAVEGEALQKYAELKKTTAAIEECTAAEVLAAKVTARFVVEGVSKAVAAQYLAERLNSKALSGTLLPAQLRALLPKYLVEAIDYVTGGNAGAESLKE
jgi:putative ATP-dependent endonuclease of OLD family